MPITRWWRRAKKSRLGNEEKGSEKRSGRWYPGCRRYCVVGSTQALIADWLIVTSSCGDQWWDSQSKRAWLSTFPPEMGVLVWLPCTGRSAENLPYILDVQNYILLDSWKTRALEWTSEKNYLDQPIWVDLPWVQRGFKRCRSPSFEQSWVSESQLNGSFRDPKLHNQGFTCRVFYQIMKPLLILCRLCPNLCWTMSYGDSSRDRFGNRILNYAMLCCRMEKDCAKFSACPPSRHCLHSPALNLDQCNTPYNRQAGSTVTPLHTYCSCVQHSIHPSIQDHIPAIS